MGGGKGSKFCCGEGGVDFVEDEVDVLVGSFIIDIKVDV